MIKGVNKQIIEIAETGNRNFERAILFVRPDSQQLEDETLRNRAISFLTQFRMRPWFYTKGALLYSVVRLLLGAAIGSGITYFLIR